MPDFDQIKKGKEKLETVSSNSLNALTFWVSLFGAGKDDEIHIEIRDPVGRIWIEKNIVQEKNRARQFYYIGKKTSPGTLVIGHYTGRMTIKRTDNQGSVIKEEIERILVISP